MPGFDFELPYRKSSNIMVLIRGWSLLQNLMTEYESETKHF